MTENFEKTRIRSGRLNGFTLIEVLVVIAVMSMMMALIMGVAKEVITQSYVKRTKMMMAMLRDRTEEYKNKIPPKAYPNGGGGSGSLVAALAQLGDVPSMVGSGYYSGGRIVDAWGNEINYYYAGIGSISYSNPQYPNLYQQNNYTPLFVSCGPDGPSGTPADDIIIPEPPH